MLRKTTSTLTASSSNSLFRASPILLATEFSDNKKKGLPTLFYRYGSGYGFDTRRRRRWTKGLRVETTENNRLTNYKEKNTLAKQVIDSIDEEKTKETNPNFVADELRVDDWKRVAFNCPKCGDSYVRSVKGRMQYRKGCKKFCDEIDNDPNVVPATVAPRLKSVKNGELLERLELFNPEKGSKELMGEMPIANRTKFNFKCADCGEKVVASTMRAAAGYCTPGQPHLHFVDNTFNNSSSSANAAMAELHSRCGECRYKMVMNKARKQMGNDVESAKKGFYGGLTF